MADDTKTGTATPTATADKATASASVAGATDSPSRSSSKLPGSFEEALLVELGDEEPAAPNTGRKHPTASDDDDEGDEIDDESGDDPEADDDESPETTESEDDPEADETDESKGDEPAEETETEDDEEAPQGLENLPPPMRKRFKKLWERDKASRREVETLTAELTEARVRPDPLPPSKREPLNNVLTLDDLTAQVESSERFLDWADEHADGFEGHFEGENVNWTAEDVQARKAYARAVLKHAPDRRQYLTDRASLKPAAYAERFYPTMFQKDHPHKQASDAILKTVPELRRMPDYEVFIGHYLRGLSEHLAEARGEAKFTRIDLRKKAQPDAKAAADAGKGKKPGKTVATKPTAAPKMVSAKPTTSQTAGRDAKLAELRKLYAETKDDDYFRQIVELETAA